MHDLLQTACLICQTMVGIVQIVVMAVTGRRMLQQQEQ
jgi:hypothetical protein